MRILIEFTHGLGDAVQLTCVLAHLRHYHPDWQIDVAALVGKHSALTGLADRVFVLGREGVDKSTYDRILALDWWEADRSYSGHPATKTEKCLYEVFALQPIRELCRYRVAITAAARQATRLYLSQFAEPTDDGRRFRAVLLHYQGNTAQGQKDLDHQTARNICEQVTSAGYVPIVLDWDNRSPLPGDGRIFCPDAKHWLWGGIGTGDACVLAALIDQVSLYIGIDSGPQKVAASTDTPTIALWTGHHPLHFHALADNVLHLVPRRHAELIRGDRAIGERAFDELYQYRLYRDLWPELSAILAERFAAGADGLIYHAGFAVREDNAPQDAIVIGDVVQNDAYSVGHLPLPSETVVDVGAHIGCFAARWRRRNARARIICVEACPENLAALRANVGSYAEVVPAACTYESEPVALLNAVWPGCVSTGGSRVLPADELAEHPTEKADKTEWWADARPLSKVTLEELMSQFQLDRIDVLKLDCEGSEFSILRNTTSLDRIGLIVGEYHGSAAFRALVQERFATWTCHLGPPDPYGNDGGPFWLFNPHAPSSLSLAAGDTRGLNRASA
jgi:FkbM family methyltransferase